MMGIPSTRFEFDELLRSVGIDVRPSRDGYEQVVSGLLACTSELGPPATLGHWLAEFDWWVHDAISCQCDPGECEFYQQTLERMHGATPFLIARGIMPDNP